MAIGLRFKKGSMHRLFRPALLPTPLEYYAAQNLRLTGKGDWLSGRCPFHPDTRPSLRVNRLTGGYRCMACGAKGGGILDFHMKRHGVSFIEAARDLGVWG